MEEKNGFNDWYIRVREKFVDRQYDQAKELDRILFTLSSGFFGISFAFISQVVVIPNPEFAWKIIVAWAFTVISIISSIISYLVVFYDYAEEIKNLDKMKEQRDKNGLDLTLTNKYKGIPELLNILTIVFLVLGFLFMIIYIADHLLEA